MMSMFGGLSEVYGLLVSFDTRRINSAAYGLECWEVFWKAFDRNIIGNVAAPNCDFLEGDIDSCHFAIGVETMAFPGHDEIIDKLERALKFSEEFARIAGEPSLQRYTQALTLQPTSLMKTVRLENGRIVATAGAMSYDVVAILNELLEGK